MPDRAWLRVGSAILGLTVLLALLSASASAGDLERHAVEVEGHPIAVWARLPDRPRRVMLLVHGRTWSTRTDFHLEVPGEQLSLFDGLAALDMAVYGVDLRGYGDTPRDASGWLTPERAAADVAAVLSWVATRHPELPAPYLFGWSYGALVAQLTAQRHPATVGALVLFGYPVRPGFDVSPLVVEPARQPTTEAAARSDFILPGTISAAAMDAFVTSALADDPVRMDWRALEQWRALDGAAVDRPTLLLQAEHDPLARDDAHAALFTSLATPDKVWAQIPGGDHAAFLETPRPYFLALIESFAYRGGR